MCGCGVRRSFRARSIIALPVICLLVFSASVALAAEKAAEAPAKEPAKAAEKEPAKEAAKAVISPEEAAVRASAEAFTKAFNAGDAKALAAMWTENGTLADDRGQLFKGRDAIEKEYTAYFQQNPGAKLAIAVTSVEIPAANMAIEDGASRVAFEHAGSPMVSRYVAVHTLQDGKWLITSVREWSAPLPPSESRIKELDWLIGKWEGRIDDVKIHASYRWIADNRFIQREYSVVQKDKVISSGSQIIGWDPQLGQVRSWTFDASGGMGEGVWEPIADGWSIATRGMLADGTPTSSLENLVRVAGHANVLGWRSSDRHAGRLTLPDTNEVVLDRVPEGK